MYKDREKRNMWRRAWRRTRRHKEREQHTRWKIENPIKYAWAMYQSNYRKNPTRAFSLPRALFEDLVTDNCFYCGAAPAPTNGIDRVDNSRGYVEDNVVTACFFCNGAKSNKTRVAFEAWLLRAAAHLSGFSQSSTRC